MVNLTHLNCNVANIIKYPLITDKTTRLLENNQYSFIVNTQSDKTTIKQSIEYLFNVKVIKITKIAVFILMTPTKVDVN